MTFCLGKSSSRSFRNSVVSAAELSILGPSFPPDSIQHQARALKPTEWNKQQFSLECIEDTHRLEQRLMGAAPSKPVRITKYKIESILLRPDSFHKNFALLYLLLQINRALWPAERPIAKADKPSCVLQVLFSKLINHFPSDSSSSAQNVLWWYFRRVLPPQTCWL